MIFCKPVLIPNQSYMCMLLDFGGKQQNPEKKINVKTWRPLKKIDNKPLVHEAVFIFDQSMSFNKTRPCMTGSYKRVSSVDPECSVSILKTHLIFSSSYYKTSNCETKLIAWADRRP